MGYERRKVEARTGAPTLDTHFNVADGVPESSLLREKIKATHPTDFLMILCGDER